MSTLFEGDQRSTDAPNIVSPQAPRQRSRTDDPTLAPELQTTDLAHFMRQAIHEAHTAGQAGELPIGAVLVVRGQIVSRGHNTNRAAQSQLRHAEMVALLGGGPMLWEHYRDAILFTTVEPCPMCLGAAVMADIPHIVFAVHDPHVCSGDTLANNPYVRRHMRSYHGGVLADEVRELIDRYDSTLLGLLRPR